jgi:general secretion pathway protein E
MGLYELLTVTEALKDKITQAPSIDALRRQAVQGRHASAAPGRRAAGGEGLTTLEEVLGLADQACAA